MNLLLKIPLQQVMNVYSADGQWQLFKISSSIINGRWWINPSFIQQSYLRINFDSSAFCSFDPLEHF